MLQSITISAAKTETVTNELMRLIYASSFFLSRYLMATSSNKLYWQESEGYRTNVL